MIPQNPFHHDDLEEGKLKRALGTLAVGAALATGAMGGHKAAPAKPKAAITAPSGVQHAVPGKDVRPMDVVKYVKKGTFAKRRAEKYKGTKEVKTCVAGACHIKRVSEVRERMAALLSVLDGDA